jgi:hypothetical protein
MKTHLGFLIVAAAGCGGTVTMTPSPAPQTTSPPPSEPVSSCFPDDIPVRPADALSGFVEPAGPQRGPYWVCDLPDRIVLVDHTTDRKGHFTGEAITIPRTAPADLARARLGRTSACTDPCGAAGEGAAGCSERAACELTSPLAGARDIVAGSPEDGPLGSLVAVDGDACAPMPDSRVIAMCATTTRTVFVTTEPCGEGTLEVDAEVFDGDHPRASLDEDDPVLDVDHELTGIAPTSDGTTWTYRFREPDATLTFDLGEVPGAIFTFDGRTEDCRVFAIDGE